MSEKDRVNILVVDDQPAKVLTYQAILKELDEHLITAGSAREAFDQLLRHDFALVLIDVGLPDLDGFQLASMMREHPRFEKTPIIFVSAIHLTDFDRLRGYESGAVDYVPVPIVPEILRAKVKVFIDLYRATRELQRVNEALEDRVKQRTAELEASTQRLQESEERLRLASNAAQFGTYDFDPATGLIHCSSQLNGLLGLPADDGKHVELAAFLSLVHEEDRQAVRDCLTGARREQDDRHNIEFRILRPDRSVIWLLDRGRAFFSPESEGPVRVMGTVLDVTERKQTEERQLLLMAELDHRVKNILANVSAIARLSSRRITSVDDFVRALDARIQAISRAHSMLRRDSWTGISLKSYLSELLDPFVASKTSNIAFEGDDLWLKPKAAQSLVLVFHELATNAAKYGALSVPDGQVKVSWTRNRDIGRDWVTLVWAESGGPRIEVAGANGFGLTVIRAASLELGAKVDHRFTPAGVEFSLGGPLEQTAKLKHGASRASPWQGSRDLITPSDAQYRVMVLEDEALIAMQVKSDLESAGHIVIGPAQTLEQGIELAETEQMDFALLDLRLGEELSTPVADQLFMRGIPFAFSTGFEDRTILPTHLQGIPRLAKPYPIGGIAQMVDLIMGRTSAHSEPPRAPEAKTG
jgi:PAS domain S-box-containing protein